MAGSFADAVQAGGMIPSISSADVKPPADAPEKPVKKANDNSMQSIVSSGEQEIKGGLQKLDALKPPPPPQFKEAPKFETSDASGQGYASAIGILGAIGSMFTRKPMVNSMNSAAAVVSAMKAGDQEAFKQSMEKWKIDNENVKTLSDYQQAIYKDILTNEKYDIDTKMGLLQSHAAAFKDDAMLQISRDKNYMDAERLNLDRENALHNWEKQSQEVEKFATENSARQELKKMYDEDYKSGAITREQYLNGLQGISTNKSVNSAPTLSSGTIDFLAHQALAGDKSVYTNMGRQASGAANVAAIRERTNQLAEEQGISPEQLAQRGQMFAANSKGLGSLSTRVANISSAGAALGDTKTKGTAAWMAVDASSKVPRGKFTPLNEALLTGKQMASDPAVSRLVVATNTLINEYSNATNPTGKGTVADRKHARELLRNVSDHRAYTAAVEQMVKEKDNALKQVRLAKKEFLDNEEEGGSSGQSYPEPTEEHIKRLQHNPGETELFDEIYGPGAAQKVLDEQ